MGDAQLISDTMRDELQKFADDTLKVLLEGMLKQLRHDLHQGEHALRANRTAKEMRGVLTSNLAKRFLGKKQTLLGPERILSQESYSTGPTSPTTKESLYSYNSTTPKKRESSTQQYRSRIMAEPVPCKAQNHASVPGSVQNGQRHGKKSLPTLKPHSLSEDHEESSWLLDQESPRELHRISAGGRDRDANTYGIYNQLSERATGIVNHQYFDLIIGVAVFLNSAALGFETDFHLKNRDASAVEPIVNAIEATFCVFFMLELSLRIVAFGKRFCSMEGWQWNLFDSLLVFMQVMDMFERSVESLHLAIDTDILRMLRILRLLRITRLVRMLHLLDELRSMITSMGSSISSLCWALVLLFLMVYIFGVFMLQLILHSGTTPANNEELTRYFGSLRITCFTLLESVWGGINWDEAVQPLMQEVYPMMGFIYSTYIGVSLLAMMNMVTAVFVERVTKTVREDKDTIMAGKIADLLFDNENPNGEISWQDFEQVLQSGVMQDYFKVLEMNPIEGENLARALFDILDMDSSGGVSSDEMVSGVLRLRGPAKALDLALLTRDIAQLQILLIELQTKSDARWMEITALLADMTPPE